jgi:GT2 family glycosyltransferase
MKSLCVLIPVYNKLDYTRQCLADLKENLKNNLTGSVQIVVIDDGSKDGTGSWIHANHPDVVVLEGTGNLFWTGAMNLGIKYAFYDQRYEYILLWNNDVMTGMDYFKNLFQVIQENPKGVLGSKIMTLQDKNTVWSFGGYFDPRSGKKGMIGYLEQDGKEYSTVRKVDWCTGMGTLIHKGVVDEIGLMEEDLFPQYFGDTDYSYRASLAGFPVMINPGLILYNDTSNTGLRAQSGFKDLIKSLFNIRSNINIKSNYAFIKKYHTSRRAYITLLEFYLKVLAGFVKWKILALMGIRRKSDRFY